MVETMKQKDSNGGLRALLQDIAEVKQQREAQQVQYCSPSTTPGYRSLEVESSGLYPGNSLIPTMTLTEPSFETDPSCQTRFETDRETDHYDTSLPLKPTNSPTGTDSRLMPSDQYRGYLFPSRKHVAGMM